MALVKLGASTITSLTDNTIEANLCNVLYNDIVDFVISEGAWSTTIFRATLAATTNTPTFGFTYEFQLPVDPLCLRVLEINETSPGYYVYSIEGDKLLAKISTMDIKYQGRLTNSQSFGPYLTKAIVSRVALELSYSITSNASLTERLANAYEKDIQEGLSIDGLQGSGVQTVSPTFTEVR